MPVADAPTRTKRQPTCRVEIARTAEQYTIWHDVTTNVPNVPGAISGSHVFGQPIASYSVQLQNMPFIPSHKDMIRIALGYEGDNHLMFVGFITNPNRQSFPRGGTVQCQDICWLADFPVQESKGFVLYDPSGNPVATSTAGIVLTGPGGTPNAIPAQQAAVRLLRDYGKVPAWRIQLPILYESPGVEWILGELSPLTWSGVSPLQVVQQIYDTLGYWVFCDYTGIIRAIKFTAVPADEAGIVFDEQAAIGSATVQPIAVPGATIGGDLSQVYNRAVAHGAQTLIVGPSVFPVTDEYQVDIPILPAGIYRERVYSNERMEYVTTQQAGDASCEAVAKRLVLEWSMQPRIVRGRVKGNPLLMVGQTHAVRSDRFPDFAQAQLAFLHAIERVTFGGGVFDMDLVLNASVPYTGIYTTLPAPTASFTFTTFRETAADGVDMIDIFCTAPAASPDGGVLTAWAWACATGTPASGSGTRWMTRVPYANGSATVTLTVTAASGKTGAPYSQVVYFNGENGQDLPQTRKISYAAKTTWYATPDTGKTWRAASGTVTVVPPIAAGGYADADHDDTEAGILANNGATIRASLDMLATAAVNRGALPAAPTRLWQNEKDPNRVWAVVGNAVHFSPNGGVSWQTKASPPVPAADSDKATRWIVEAFDAFGTLDVLAGRYGYTTFDAATANYELRLTGPAGSKAWCYASGHDSHWAGFIDTPTGQSPLRSFEGHVAAFPAVTPEVLHIRALTMLVDTPDLYALDDQGRMWRLDARTGTGATHVATIPSGSANTPHHMIRDGDFRLIYVAALLGLYKFFVDLNEFVLFKAALTGEEGLMVGYAGLAEIVPPVGPTNPTPPPSGTGGTTETGTTFSNSTPNPGVHSKAYRAWPSPNTPPANWHTLAFNDSAWAVAVIQSTALDYVTGAWPIGAANYVFPSGGGTGEKNWIRHTFTAPADATGGTLVIQVNEESEAVYFNGTLLGTMPWDGSGNTHASFVLPAGLVLPGATNVIAYAVTNLVGSAFYSSFRFDAVRSGGTAPTPDPGDKVPTMAVDATNGKTWYTYTQGTNVFLREGTLTSAPGAAIDIGDQGGVAGYYTASCVADRSTKLHMAWSDNGAAVRYRSRLASGGSMSAPIAVASGLTKAAQVDIGVNRSSVSGLAVLWRNLDTGLISVSRSEDAGATWAAPVTIAGPASYAGVARFARGSRDALVFTGADGRVQLARRIGGAWVVETVSGADISFFQPTAVLLGDGRIAVAYRKIPNQVWLAVKALDGLWTREIVDTDDEVAGPVAVGTDAVGRIHVAWAGKVGGVWDVFLRTKTGAIWASVITCSTGGAGYKINVDLDAGAGDAGTRHVVWENWNVSPDVIAYARV